MAQDIALMGAIYLDTPSVRLPKNGGGYATFTDTSDADATAADIAQGKTAYVNGSKVTGTASGSGVSVVTTQDSHGGDIVTITAAEVEQMKPYVLRPDAELVATYAYDHHINADEGITIPAYTTAATTLKASANLTPTLTMDLANYNYYVAIRCLTIPEYSISTKAKGRCEYLFASALYEVAEFPANTLQALVDTTKQTSRSINIYSAGNCMGEIYWTSASAITRYSTATYGTYQTVTAPAVSGTTLTLKSPAFGVRGHGTYFVNTFFNALTDIRYQYVIEVYRAPKNNLAFNGWGLYDQATHILDCVQSDTRTLN